jgi:hypothetical protein
MNQEFTDAKELAELEQIGSYIQNAGLKTVLFKKEGINLMNVLSVKINKEISFNIIFLPIPADQFIHVSVLQFYSVIADKVKINNDLLFLLNKINSDIPLGHYVVNEDEELCFKHIYTKPKTDVIEEGYLLELLPLITTTIEFHSPILKHLISGSVSLEKALEALRSEAE